MEIEAKTDTLENYRRACRDFRWETPEHFNFAAVIDKFAEDPRRRFFSFPWA